jgi:hypothetical protein
VHSVTRLNRVWFGCKKAAPGSDGTPWREKLNKSNLQAIFSQIGIAVKSNYHYFSNSNRQRYQQFAFI